MQNEIVYALRTACSICAVVCTRCAATFVVRHDFQETVIGIRLMMQCANICRMIESLTHQNIDNIFAICKECLDLCKSCGEFCKSHGEPTCLKCAEECDACMVQCHKLLSCITQCTVSNGAYGLEGRLSSEALKLMYDEA